MFRRFRSICLVLPILAGVAAMVLAAGCSSGGGGSAGSDPESALKNAIDAWNAKDVGGFLALVNDNFLTSEFGFSSRYEAEQGLTTGIGVPELSLGDLSDVLITGDTAAVSAQFYFGQMGSRDAFSLVKAGDVWQLDSDDPTPGDVPEGTTSVDLTMDEYSFNFDESAVASGDFGFAVSNVGSEDHNIALLKVPDDLSIDDLINAQTPLDGVTEIGFAGPFSPGSSTSLLFKDRLASGRYVMLCLVSAPDGVDHAKKGMVAEFTVAD